MKKSIMLALLGLMFIGGTTSSYAQQDSAKIAEQPQDTISIDNMDPKFYEEEAPKESSSMMTYAIVGGVLIIGAGAYMVIRKKKK